MKNFLIVTFLFITVHGFAEVKLEDCATIQSDVKRLACYDYILTGVSKTSEELVKKENVTPAQSEEISTFGLSNKQKQDANIQVIKSKLASSISSVAKAVGGKTRFKLSNDQLWESQSVLSSIKLNNFRVQNKIVIEEATMGGFWMINTSSNVKIKVKRVS